MPDENFPNGAAVRDNETGLVWERTPDSPREDLAISNMWETSALVELLERKGILNRKEVLAMIQELRQREPNAIPPRRFDT